MYHRLYIISSPLDVVLQLQKHRDWERSILGPTGPGPRGPVGVEPHEVETVAPGGPRGPAPTSRPTDLALDVSTNTHLLVADR